MRRKVRSSRRTYIRLAAYFSSQPPGIDQLVLHLSEIEQLIGERLPAEASSSPWWSNESALPHHRAWLVSGWRVAAMDDRANRVAFVRIAPDGKTRHGSLL